MNIIEAIKSGRPFKRGGMSYWVKLNVKTQTFQTEDGSDSYPLSDSSMWDSVFLCDDWEIKPEVREVTDAQFNDAVREGLVAVESQRKIRNYSGYDMSDLHFFALTIKERLGLGGK